MFTIFIVQNYKTLSKRNGSRVFAIKQNVNFKCQLPTMFVYLVLRKNGLIISCLSS
jgi:hypothetical protein